MPFPYPTRLDGERKTAARSAVTAREGREQPSHQKMNDPAASRWVSPQDTGDAPQAAGNTTRKRFKESAFGIFAECYSLKTWYIPGIICLSTATNRWGMSE